MTEVKGICAYTERTIKRLINMEKKEMSKLMAELKRSPAGTLYIKPGKKKLFPYEMKNGQERSISKNTDRIHSLACKRFVQHQLKQLQAQSEILENAFDKITKASKKIENSSGSKTVKNIAKLMDEDMYLLNANLRLWKKHNQEKNDYRREERRYRSINGILVRSKSEREIVNKLVKRGVVFCYEAEIILNGNTYYPDFLIMKPDGELIIWEHFGLMDDQDYYLKACHKIELYRQEGFYQHTNLICTYESDMISVDRLDEIIDRFVYN